MSTSTEQTVLPPLMLSNFLTESKYGPLGLTVNIIVDDHLHDMTKLLSLVQAGDAYLSVRGYRIRTNENAYNLETPLIYCARLRFPTFMGIPQGMFNGMKIHPIMVADPNEESRGPAVGLRALMFNSAILRSVPAALKTGKRPGDEWKNRHIGTINEKLKALKGARLSVDAQFFDTASRWSQLATDIHQWMQGHAKEPTDLLLANEAIRAIMTMRIEEINLTCPGINFYFTDDINTLDYLHLSSKFPSAEGGVDRLKKILDIECYDVCPSLPLLPSQLTGQLDGLDTKNFVRNCGYENASASKNTARYITNKKSITRYCHFTALAIGRDVRNKTGLYVTTGIPFPTPGDSPPVSITLYHTKDESQIPFLHSMIETVKSQEKMVSRTWTDEKPIDLDNGVLVVMTDFDTPDGFLNMLQCIENIPTRSYIFVNYALSENQIKMAREGVEVPNSFFHPSDRGVMQDQDIMIIYRANMAFGT